MLSQCAALELSKRLNLSVQTAFMTCRLILMQMAFGDKAIQNTFGHFKRFLRLGFIAGFNCENGFLQVGAHHRTHACVMGTMVFGLNGSFLCFFSICPSNAPGLADQNDWLFCRRTCPMSNGFCPTCNRLIDQLQNRVVGHTAGSC